MSMRLNALYQVVLSVALLVFRMRLVFALSVIPHTTCNSLLMDQVLNPMELAKVKLDL